MTPILTSTSSAPVPPTFPPSSNPRVWLLTSGPCPVGITVARAILEHGDSVVLGLPKPIDGIDIPGSARSGAILSNGESGTIEGEEDRNRAFMAFWNWTRESKMRERCRVVGLDGR